MTNDEYLEYLRKCRAWNWQWPDERNCWDTHNAKRKRPTEPYHGPSKKAIARRNRKKGGQK